MSASTYINIHKQFDELVRALQNCQTLLFTEILDGENGAALLSWKVRISNQVMTPIIIACKFSDTVETLSSFFDCIRRIGGNELLKSELAKDGRRAFQTVLEEQDQPIIIFFLRTLFRLGEEFMRTHFQFEYEPSDNGLKDINTGVFPPIEIIHSRAKFPSSTKKLKDTANILGYYLLKFNPRVEVLPPKKTSPNSSRSSYSSPYNSRSPSPDPLFRMSDVNFGFFHVTTNISDYQNSLIADFEKKAQEEEDQFADQQLQMIKHEVKEEHHEEEEETVTRENLESKVRIMHRELEVERRALANEKTAHEFTKEQLRIALKLADSAAGTRRQREEDDEEEAVAAASLKATRRVKKTT